MAGGPVGGWGGVNQPIRAETGAGGLLNTAVTKQNVANARCISGRMHLQ